MSNIIATDTDIADDIIAEASWNIDSSDIWDHWVMPDSDPRKTQVEVLDWLSGIGADKRHVIVEAPVGAGKSPIALTFASFLGQGHMGSSYILTPQRILQRQYEESFDDGRLLSVYGKANYMCNMKVGLNCDDGSDIKPKCKNCPASDAINAIGTTPHVVLNYKLALLYAEILYGTDMFPTKDLAVFDECHTLESHLVNHRALEITRKRCEKHKIVFYQPDDLSDAHGWLREDYLPPIGEAVVELELRVKAIDNKYNASGSSALLPDEIRAKREYKRLKRHYDLVKEMAEHDTSYLNNQYVLVTDRNEKMTFKEIYGRRIFRNTMGHIANRFLHMSSTVLNADAYARDLGIEPDEVAVTSLPSEFDVNNRPVYFMPTAKMSYGWNNPKDPEKAKLRQKMIDQVVKLCKDMHPEESGIIHTGSFQIAKWLIDEIQSLVPQKIITHKSDEPETRDECIEEFTSNNGEVPMLLISPSLTEGLDLKDEQARFCIFVKVPYPFLGDEWVKRRLDLSDEWYQRQAMTAIIQGGGRIVRGPEDYGNTYILDESFGFLWFKYKDRAPIWWKDGFTRINK